MLKRLIDPFQKYFKIKTFINTNTGSIFITRRLVAKCRARSQYYRFNNMCVYFKMWCNH